MKFHRQLQPATETSWVVSYGGKTIPRWRTAAILKIVISPYRSEKSSDFDEIICTAADFELDERHVIKNKVALNRLSSSTERICCFTTKLNAMSYDRCATPRLRADCTSQPYLSLSIEIKFYS